MNTYPRTFSHIGISVPEVEKAVEFYSKVMGCYSRILSWRLPTTYLCSDALQEIMNK
jgi:predicted enzyme related to lactoylglutathione lyase